MASGRTCARRYAALPRHGGRAWLRAQPARGIGGHAAAVYMRAISPRSCASTMPRQRRRPASPGNPRPGGTPRRAAP